MKAWDELLQYAIVGTARQPNPPLRSDVPPGVEKISADRFPDNNDRLLALAGVLGQALRCNATPAHWADPLPEPAPAEDRPTPGEGLLARYDQVKAAHPQLVREWLEYAAQAGWRMPPTHVPEILDHALHDHGFRPVVAALVGQAGRWLCTQEDRWKNVFAEISIHEQPLTLQTWEEGSLDQRLAFLRTQRQQDPDAARDLLIASFSSFPAREREQFLSCLQLGLSPRDEPFLDSCLNDKGRMVRMEARHLLFRIPTSAFAQRMRIRLSKYYKLQRSGTMANLVGKRSMELEIEWPKDLGPEDHRDLECESNPNLNELRNRLRQITGFLRIEDWMDAFSLSEDDMEYLILHGKIQDPQMSENWQQAMWSALGQMGTSRSAFLYRFAGIPRLIQALDHPTRVLLLERAAERQDADVALTILMAYGGVGRRLTESLSSALLRVLVPRFGPEPFPKTDSRAHQQAFTTLAHCLHPSSYPVAAQLLPPVRRENLHPDFAEFIQHYQNRHDIHKELLP